MHSLAAAQCRGFLGSIPELVRPWAGGIHHAPRANHLAGLTDRVRHPHADHSTLFALITVDPSVVCSQGPVLVRSPDVRQRQPSVITLGIVVDARALQIVRPQVGLAPQHLSPGEDSMPPHVPEHGERVVHEEPRAQFPQGHSAALMDREEELTGPHQMGGNPQERTAFTAGLEHQSEIAHLQISESTVYHSGRAAAGATSEIRLVDDGGADSPHCGIPGDPGTGDPATNDEEIYWIGAHGPEVVLASRLRKRWIHECQKGRR